jgi:hypothetical protein
MSVPAPTTQRGQVDGAEERSGGGQRVHRRVHVVMEPGKGELLRTAPTTVSARATPAGRTERTDGLYRACH